MEDDDAPWDGRERRICPTPATVYPDGTFFHECTCMDWLFSPLITEGIDRRNKVSP
jgi:hypothetical protein